MTDPPTLENVILLVEDSEDDVFLMRRALRDAGVSSSLHVLEHGEQAIAYLSGRGEYADRARHPLPRVIFLDLKLPYRSGHEVVAWIRAEPRFAAMLVVVLTSSEEPLDLQRAYQLGANSYLVKPPTAEQLAELARAFHLWWRADRSVAPPEPILDPAP